MVPDWIDVWLKRWLTKDRAEVGMAVFGMAALVTPLLLWVAFSLTMLKIVLTVGLGSVLLATLCAQYCCPDEVTEEERMRPPDVDEMLEIMDDLKSRARRADGASSGPGWRDNA